MKATHKKPSGVTDRVRALPPQAASRWYVDGASLRIGCAPRHQNDLVGANLCKLVSLHEVQCAPVVIVCGFSAAGASGGEDAASLV